MKMATPDINSTKSSGKRTSLTFRLLDFSDILSSLKSFVMVNSKIYKTQDYMEVVKMTKAGLGLWWLS